MNVEVLEGLPVDQPQERELLLVAEPLRAAREHVVRGHVGAGGERGAEGQRQGPRGTVQSLNLGLLLASARMCFAAVNHR